jgi:hypothetical protein
MGASAIVTRIDESDARKMLTTAEWYLRRDDYIAAEYTIRRLLRRYPRTIAAADALRLILGILNRLPENVIDDGPDYTALRAAILGPEVLRPDERAAFEQSEAAASPFDDAPPTADRPTSSAEGGPKSEAQPDPVAGGRRP